LLPGSELVYPALASDSTMSQDFGTFIQTNPHSLRLLNIRRADIGFLSLRLSIITAFSGPDCPHSFRVFDINCLNAVEYSIRPKDPNTIEGGPLIEFHEHHRLLETADGECVPGGDGLIRFNPPLKLKLLILDQSFVIAERFEFEEILPNKSV